ncbi:RCC1 domain-containing protein [Caballeronia sp. SBC2]
MRSWGCGSHGSCSRGTTTSQRSPRQLAPSPRANVAQVDAGR